MDAVCRACRKGNAPLLPSLTVSEFPVYLFDLDGTLLDSAADICGAIQQVLSGHVSAPLDYEYLKGFIGYHLNDCFTEVLPQFTPEQLAALVTEYRAIYPARGHSSTYLYSGVSEGLAMLSGRKGTATTKGTPTTRAILEQFGLLRYFDHVQGTDGFPCKPAPDVILRSLAALNAAPEDCLFVGDSEADMQAGRAAGVKICAVRYGYGKHEDLAKWQPDYWISDLRDLSTLRKNG